MFELYESVAIHVAPGSVLEFNTVVPTEALIKRVHLEAILLAKDDLHLGTLCIGHLTFPGTGVYLPPGTEVSYKNTDITLKQSGSLSIDDSTVFTLSSILAVDEYNRFLSLIQVVDSSDSTLAPGGARIKIYYALPGEVEPEMSTLLKINPQEVHINE